ncbi:nitrate/TMAO reductase, membrane-bound tetraheme cytochrome c subunit [Thioflavicoccus mobilis 8321]|uniref:Cytochrome c-type protein n=1 Tax=Thioflavicoccus mobilis 8321 TaxID=765912 RepID=L0H2P2_9GAMM|nr:NapC/NirT family cytochrome c [Thioflavicoccus mobilis]AGA91925.1 nitrate/TMAO reductase, membrane-bound tetraheme cytochrome c subunit [Thioflavicoccus mobilis 8321]
MLKWIIATLVILIAAPFVIVGSWLATEGMLQATADEPFCGICHTMTPFVTTHEADVHGGSNARGLVAKCTDCHLPHDSNWAYLTEKARSGLHDVWGQLTHWVGLNKIDWEAKLAERDSFVFDSGCRHCHAALDREDNPRYAIHSRYFSANGSLKCVTCHRTVGHHELAEALKGPADKDQAPD